MKKQHQTVPAVRPFQLWVRLAAALGIVLLLLCSGLQAAHLHHVRTSLQVQSGPELISTVATPDADANCLLCLTSETTFVTGLPCSPPVLLLVVGLVACCATRFVPTEVHFAQSTRPPPAA